MSWKEREPMPEFLTRWRDHWMRRAELATSDEVRDESEAEAMDLDALSEQFGRLAR